MNIFFFLGIVFLVSFIFGHMLEKFRIPWIFSALLLGVVLSFHNPFTEITQSSPFTFMSQVGLYLLLFLIGFELDIGKILKSGRFIVMTTFAVELLEMLLVGTALHFIFSLSWLISMLLALSFATVGEAILLPMLEEFGLIKTKLGQMILGIATFDDVFEIFVILGISVFIPILFPGIVSQQLNDPLIIRSILLLSGLLVCTLLIVKKLKKGIIGMKVPNIAAVLPLLLSVLFIFTGIDTSEGSHIAVLGALFAGIFIKNLLSAHFLEEVEPQIKTITYGLFAPIFFLGIGLDSNVSYLLSHFWLIVIIVLIAKFAKIAASYFMGRSKLGTHASIFMGVALGVRFSTSIVFLKILFDNHMITAEIYSIMIGSSIVFKFIIPPLLAFLSKRWHLAEAI